MLVTNAIEERDGANAAANVDERLSLYGRHSCGYCTFVLKELERLDLDVPFRDTTLAENREELVAATGRTQVPVLRIDTPMGTRWMPESVDIVRYLKAKANVPQRNLGDVAIQMLGALAIALLVSGFTWPTAKIPLWAGAATALFVRAIVRWRR